MSIFLCSSETLETSTRPVQGVPAENVWSYTTFNGAFKKPLLRSKIRTGNFSHLVLGFLEKLIGFHIETFFKGSDMWQRLQSSPESLARKEQTKN